MMTAFLFADMEPKMPKPRPQREPVAQPDDPNAPVIYNVGYQGRTINEFCRLVKEAGVTLLVDVRSVPYSRQANFTKGALAANLQRYGVKYLWRGATMGGKPGTWTPEGRRKSCKELLDKYQQETLAVMCMERSVHACHRKELGVVFAECGWRNHSL